MNKVIVVGSINIGIVAFVKKLPKAGEIIFGTLMLDTTNKK